MSSIKVSTVSFLILLCAFSIAQEDISSTPSEGCNPMAVKFAITGIDTNTITNVSWNFGGSVSTKKNPDSVIFRAPGVYPITCQIDARPLIQDTVTIHERIRAGFRVDSIDLLTRAFIPIDSIRTNDNFAYSWRYFNEEGSLGNTTKIVTRANLQNAADTFAFPDTGLYRAALRIRNIDHGCMDTLLRSGRILPVPIQNNEKIKPGNVFSPNSPGGEFYIIEPDDPAVILSFEVFSRTGVPLYKSLAPSVFWDGRTNDGRVLNTGVYFYLLRATTGDLSGYYSTSGFIHLFTGN